MALGQEYLTSNRQIAYPFAEDATGLTSGAFPSDLFVDMVMLCHSEHTRVYLSTFQYVGGQIQLAFVNQSLQAVYECAADWTPGDEYYTELQFDALTPSTFHPTLRAVVHTQAMVDYLSGYAGPLALGQVLPLEMSVVVPRALRVDTLELYTGPDGMPALPEPTVEGPIRGDVQLLSGYNIDQFVESAVIPLQELDPVSDTVAVNLSAIAGLGQGLYPCQDPVYEPPGGQDDRPRMRLTPDEDGNVNIEPGDEQCYSVVPLPGTGQIQLQGTCEACCQCEDYDRVAKTLQNLLERSKAILEVLNDTRDKYEEGVTHFNDTISPIYHSLHLQLNGSGGPPPKQDDKIVSHAVNWANLMASLKNNLPNAVQPHTCQLVITSPSPCTVRYANWEYDSDGNQLPPSTFVNLLQAGVPPIDTGKSIYMEFRLYTSYETAVAARSVCEANKIWIVKMIVQAYDLKDGSNQIITVEDDVTFG